MKTERLALRSHRSSRVLWLTFVGWLAAHTAAQAHPGHLEANGLAAGLLHPVSGLDHLIVMLAVGLWSAQLGGRGIWLVPFSFLGMVAVGAGLGWSGVPLPFVEAGILASIVTLGLLLTSAVRGPVWWCAALVGLFALWHGHAHGTEMPTGAARLTYGLGFVVATGLLQLAGMLLGNAAQRLARPNFLRFAGAVVLATGAYLWLV